MIGLRIRQARLEHGMSQRQLGLRLGGLLGREWPRQQITSAEAGKRAFTSAELVAIAAALDTPLMVLFAPPPGVQRLELTGGSVDVDRVLLGLPPHERDVVGVPLAAALEHVDRLKAMATEAMERINALHGGLVNMALQGQAEPEEGS